MRRGIYSIIDCGCLEKDQAVALAELGPFSGQADHSDGASYEHDRNAIGRAADGSWVHAACGGCSCRESGDFSVWVTREEALRCVPEYCRDKLEPVP